MKVIKAQERYLTQFDWLKSYHSFSFGEHFHTENKGWGTLRVINEDYIAAGGFFDTHPHRDMEIVSYLVKGQLHHKDSAGNEYTIQAGDVQRISAGSGIAHSEENRSKDEETHLMQLWIKPNIKHTKPDYAQISLNPDDKINKLQLLASETARDGSISIKQDTDIYSSILEKDQALDLQITKDKAWIQLISGSILVNDSLLETGDALALEAKQELKVKNLSNESHFLFFDITT